jgi:hypothetical protein
MKLKKSTREWLSIVIMVISATIIIFNNVGQSFQLFQIPLSKTTMYWIAGICFFIGAVWTMYIEKVLK